MRDYFKLVFEIIARLYSYAYTYRISRWFASKRNRLYTFWVSNFIGEVGKGCTFQYPLRLQGGGNSRIHIGDRTSIQSFSILGCWVRYGKDEQHDPYITIGSDCNIGEFCQITAIRRISIGDGLLTGRFVYIGDNAHGSLSWEESDTPPAKRHLLTSSSCLTTSIDNKLSL